MKALVLAVAMCASSAFAVSNQNLSFDQLKLACKEPGRFQNQMKPSELKITCSDRVYRWVPAGTAPMTMPSKRTVFFKVSSDKYTVPGSQQEIAAPELQTECPMLKQVEETTSISKELTCEQIEAFEGTTADLCVSYIDELRKENASSVEIRETGSVVSFCKPGSSKPGNGDISNKPLK